MLWEMGLSSAPQAQSQNVKKKSEMLTFWVFFVDASTFPGWTQKNSILGLGGCAFRSKE